MITIPYIVFSLLILYILGFYISKYFYQKKRFEEIINASVSKQTCKSLNLSDDKVKELLFKLEKFEKSNDFLKKDILIQDFAKNYLNSNDKYLINILSKYKNGRTFNNYLNELRINWFINRIREDKKYRNYTLKTYADDSGFTNDSSFVSAFEKLTKLKLHFFLNQSTKLNNSNK